MQEQMSLGQVEEPSFSRTFLGYDPSEVRAFIKRMNDRMGLLDVQGASVAEENGAVVGQDLGEVIDSAVGDIAQLLEAARATAERMRTRAEHEASDSVEAAAAQIRKMLAEAESTAFSLRKVAWDASTEMLENAKAEGIKLHRAAERDALAIINDAERKAHRKLAAARRDGENVMQTVNVECDRTMSVVRSKGQAILQDAHDRAESIREKVEAMEERHAEMAREVQAFEATLSGPSAEEEGVAEQNSTVRIIQPVEDGPVNGDANGDAERSRLPTDMQASRTIGWADGTANVKLVEALGAERPTPAEQVIGLLSPGPEASATPASYLPADGIGDFEGVRIVRPEPSPTPTPGSIGTHPGTEQPNGAVSDELAALFSQLRMGGGAKSAPTPAPSPRPPRPMDLYQDALLPVTNRALRAVKRQLIDIQNAQIEELEKDPEQWQPERSGLASSLIHTVGVMERESFEKGYSSASEITGLDLPTLRAEPPTGGGESFMSDLADEVTRVAHDARQAGRTGREMSGVISRLYRMWRTDEADRRLRFLGGRVYHQGLVRGLAEAGVEGFRVEIDKACGECTPHAGEPLAEPDIPAIPAHAECRCTIIPA